MRPARVSDSSETGCTTTNSSSGFQRDVDAARLLDHGRTIRPPTATDLVRAARPVYRRMRPPPAGVSQRVWSFLIVPFDQSWASALLTHARSVDPCSKTS